tara:strand:- start:3618 stop:4349 length:732 start_codon:yes stop_codon:yes gene_type:complete
MGSIKVNSMDKKKLSKRITRLMSREGSAAVHRTTVPYSGIKGSPNTRVKDSSDYGLYYDSEGKLTSGFGDLITDDQEAHDKLNLSKEKALKQLKQNISIHDEASSKILQEENINTSSWTDHQKDAFKDMVFQLGPAKTKTFKRTLTFLKNKNFKEAAKEVARGHGGKGVSEWAKQTLPRVKDFQEGIVPKQLDKKAAVKKLKQEVSEKDRKIKRYGQLLKALKEGKISNADFQSALRIENISF